jgi:hypothetical protein
MEFISLQSRLCFICPIGILADKIGLKKMLILNRYFSIVYGGMGFNHNRYVFFGLFALYGIYAAASEGISKAWISNISKEKIPRPLSATIPLSKLFHHAGQFLGRTYLVSVWSGCHFIVTAFASILIGLYFIFMTTEKSII